MQTAFLQDICEHPDEDAPRLVYADWCEDNDLPDRAAFIRAQIELHHLAESDPQRLPLLHRAGELLHLHEKEWVGELHGLVLGGRFRRGFLEIVTVEAGTFLTKKDLLFQLAPLQGVCLRGVCDVLPALTRVSPDPRLVRLEVGSNMMHDGDLDRLCGAPLLETVRFLDVSNNFLTPGAVAMLAWSPCAHQLEELSMGLNNLDGPLGAAFAEADGFMSLRGLDLKNSNLETGLISFGQAPCLARLDRLGLSMNFLRQGTLRPLLAARFRPAFLDLSWNFLDDSSITELAQSTFVSSAAWLNLGRNAVGRAGLRALLESPYLTHLEYLGLGGTKLEDDDLLTLLDLLEEVRGGRLRCLDLRDSKVLPALAGRLGGLVRLE